MPVICISSPQGVSGKTTLAANLASAYAYRGNKVLLIDLNVQNALRHYFNLTLVGPHGFVPYIDNTDDWGQFILKVDTNLYLLPYGDVTWKQHLDFQMLIHEKPDVFGKISLTLPRKVGWWLSLICQPAHSLRCMKSRALLICKLPPYWLMVLPLCC